MSVIIFFLKRGVALSRDSQNVRVPRNISGTGRDMNVEVVNKTANIKCKKLASLQHRVRPTNSHIKNGTNHLLGRTDLVISSFYQLGPGK